MPRLFISHSSKQNAEALALSAWLTDKGFADHFLDVDSIQPFEVWQTAFERSATVCEAVLVVMSKDWLESHWCRREADIAREHDKPVLTVVVKKDGVPPPNDPRQWLDLTSIEGEQKTFELAHPRLPGGKAVVDWPKEGLAALEKGLIAANLIGESFKWPPPSEPDRSPYPGLRALDQADAAVYFGRRASLVKAVEIVERLASSKSLSVLCMLGASGSGKSSFLRAGLLPRLVLRSHRLSVVPTLRVGSAARALEQALAKQPRPAAPPHAASHFASPPDAAAGTAAIDATTSALEAASRLCTVIPLDQAEELFAPTARADATRFLERVQAQATTGSVLLLMALRSEHIETLQQQPWFRNLHSSRKELIDLEALPESEYRDVIEGPARVQGERTKQRVDLEPSLIDALVKAHSGSQDALPMLALTLESLYRPKAREAVARLTLADFEALERDGGVVRQVIRSAWLLPESDPVIPASDDARQPHLERLFAVLASYSAATEQPMRRVATHEEINALGPTPKALVRRLIEQRILTSYGRTGAVASDDHHVEIAHEAVLRTWPVLTQWLERRRSDLTIADNLEGNARRWVALGSRLNRGVAIGGDLRAFGRVAYGSDLRGRFGADVHAYLTTSRWRNRARHAVWIGLLSGVALVALGLVTIGYQRANGFPARQAFLAPVSWLLPWTHDRPTFLQLRPGKFVAGCVPGRDVPAGQACPDHVDPEQAVKDVAFECELQTREVTFEQFDRFVFDTQGRIAAYPPAASSQQALQPVVGVSIQDAQAFARWLCSSGDQRSDYRLPTVDEWEYGARGGATGEASLGPYPWGDETPKGRAVCDGCESKGVDPAEAQPHPAPVASLSAFGGLYDMSGNVREWVTDPAGAREAGKPYQARGGSFKGRPEFVRIIDGQRFARDPRHPLDLDGDDETGFRLCRVPKAKEQPCAAR